MTGLLMDTSVGSLYSRAQVSAHNTAQDCWLIVRGKVYDVTRWLYKHPGGWKLLLYHAGQDATIVFQSFHPSSSSLHRILNTYYIGDIIEEEREVLPILQDFLKLKSELVQKGLFKRDPFFFWLHLSICILLELMGVALLYYGSGLWTVWLMAAVLIAISHSHTLGLGHHLGHCCLFKSIAANHLAQSICLGTIMGHSATWWDYRHFRHHAKTNVYDKDPDITFTFDLALIGTLLPKEWAQKRRGQLPYQFQYIYISLLIPPVLFSIILGTGGVFRTLLDKKWMECLWILLFYVRWYFMYSALLGGFWSALCYCIVIKFLFSIWWTTIAFISHMPMEAVLKEDTDKDWVTAQMTTTCNVHSNWFVDFFMEHLHYQIEHHLFPTMPPSKLHIAQPYVREFCHKHNIEYQIKPFFQAVVDIPKSLKKSGEIWLKEYQESTAKSLTNSQF